MSTGYLKIQIVSITPTHVAVADIRKTEMESVTLILLEDHKSLAQAATSQWVPNIFLPFASRPKINFLKC